MLDSAKLWYGNINRLFLIRIHFAFIVHILGVQFANHCPYLWRWDIEFRRTRFDWHIVSITKVRTNKQWNREMIRWMCMAAMQWKRIQFHRVCLLVKSYANSKAIVRWTGNLSPFTFSTFFPQFHSIDFPSKDQIKSWQQQKKNQQLLRTEEWYPLIALLDILSDKYSCFFVPIFWFAAIFRLFNLSLRRRGWKCRA